MSAPPVLVSRPPRSTFSRCLDQATVYLPVLLMALLALGSYWLLRATPDTPAPAAARPPTQEPDYFMRGFSVKLFDASGALTTEVHGAEVRHRPDTDSTEIEQARIRLSRPGEPLTTATAEVVKSNAQQTEFDLLGNAVLVREAGQRADGTPLSRVEFRGEQLRVVTQPEHISSQQPVTLLRGQDRLSADTLDYRGEEQVAVFRGRVKALLVP